MQGRQGEQEEHPEPEDRPFRPDWTSPPGHTIATVLQERKITVSDFASRMQESVDWCERLLAGNEPIDLETAVKLSRILGSTIPFWLRREEQYRSDLARGLKP